MPRQHKHRKGAAPAADARPAVAVEDSAEGPVESPNKTRAKLILEGDADSVRSDFSGKAPEGVKPTAVAPEPEKSSDKVDFLDALANPENEVVVTRIYPQKIGKTPINVEVYREHCPLDMASIEQAVFEGHGGVRYQVAVVDPDRRRLVARVIEKQIPPLLDGEVWDQEAPPTQPQHPMETEVATLQMEAQLAEQQTAVERAKKKLREIREEATKPAGNDPRIIVLEENLRALMKSIDEQKAQQAAERSERRIEALERRLEENRKPAKDDAMTLLLQQMREDRLASDKRFDSLVAAMRDQKQDAMLEELRALRTSGSKKGDLLESIEQVKALAEMMGWKMPGDDDEEGPDDREWWRVLLEDHVPKLINVFEEKNKKGESFTKEQVLAAIDKAAVGVTSEIRARQAAGRLPPPTAAPPAPKLPVAPGAPAAPAAPAAGPPPIPEPTGPPPLSDGAITVDLPALPAPTQSAARPPTIDEDVRIRVSSTFDCLDHESRIRPQAYEWSLFAWRNLPTIDGGALDLLAHAADAAAALQVFVPHVDAEKMRLAAERLQTDPKLAVWIRRGLDDLLDWWGELAKDPNFDPESDDEPEPEPASEGA